MSEGQKSLLIFWLLILSEEVLEADCASDAAIDGNGEPERWWWKQPWALPWFPLSLGVQWLSKCFQRLSFPNYIRGAIFLTSVKLNYIDLPFLLFQFGACKMTQNFKKWSGTEPFLYEDTIERWDFFSLEREGWKAIELKFLKPWRMWSGC